METLNWRLLSKDPNGNAFEVYCIPFIRDILIINALLLLKLQTDVHCYDRFLNILLEISFKVYKNSQNWTTFVIQISLGYEKFSLIDD